MEKFLSNFANVNAEVKSSNAEISVSPEFYGTIDISKGLFKMTISFYARVYKSIYENCATIEDWEVTETSNVSFNGMPIDDIDKLIKTLEESGLKTLAEGLKIGDDDCIKAIREQIYNSKLFKSIYGKDAKLFKMLSDEEQARLQLKYAIDNYDKMTIGHYVMRNILTKDTTDMPTLEELIQRYNDHTKNN